MAEMPQKKVSWASFFFCFEPEYICIFAFLTADHVFLTDRTFCQQKMKIAEDLEAEVQEKVFGVKCFQLERSI